MHRSVKLALLGVIFSAKFISAANYPNSEDMVMAGVRPPQEPLDVENYPVAPEGLELNQVHVYVRHGGHIFMSSVARVDATRGR